MATKIKVLEELRIAEPLVPETSRGMLREVRQGHKGHVVAILPRGEAIRNFVYTGALDDVLRVAEVSLLSVIPNSELRNLMDARYTNVFELE